LATPTSANLASAVTNETGSGSLVFGTSPTITTSLEGGSSIFSLLNSGVTNLSIGGDAGYMYMGASNSTLTLGANLFLGGTGAYLEIADKSVGTPGTSGMSISGNYNLALGPYINFISYNGTYAAKTAITTGQSLGYLTFSGQTSSGSRVSARINVKATQDFTTENLGSSVVMQTSANNTNFTVDSLIVTSAATTAIANFVSTGNGAGLTFSGTGNHDITASSGTLRLGATTFTGTITASTTTFSAFDTTITTGTIFGAATSGTFGYTGTGSSTTNISTGVVGSGYSKTVNIGTSGASGSNTTVNIGQGSLVNIGGALFVGGSTVSPPETAGLSGTWFGWNVSAGNGESVFANYRQGGIGGFAWRVYANNGALASSPMYLKSDGNLTLGLSSSRLGVCTSSPVAPLHVVAAGTQITAFGDTPTQAFIEGTNLALSTQLGNLIVGTNTAQAVNMGGSITLGGKHTDAGSFACWATIKSGKDNSTSGDFGGYLSLCSRANGQNITEAIRILANQNVAIGATTASEKLQVTGNILGTGTILSNSATSGIGYATGAGGTVIQATSKTTSVTINKITGSITMNNAALAAFATVVFTVNNSSVAVGDVVVVTSQGGYTADYRGAALAVAAGSFKISVTNISGSSASEAVVLNFAIIKCVSA